MSIVLISYLAVSSGIVINFHYCMNKLASTKLFAAESKQCGTCGMHTDDSNGCCRDEVKIVKMEDDQKLATTFTFELPSSDAQFHVPSEFIVTSFYNVPGSGHFLNHSPPLLSAQDIYLQNGVFRI